MRYREYKLIGEKVSVLGFGCMRFPRHPDNTVNKLKAVRLLRQAYRLGVNYFDTSHVYAKGGSELALGHALKPFRNKVIISTKNPVRVADTPDIWRQRIDISLERLQGPADIMNFHRLSWKSFREKVLPRRTGILAAARKAQSEGIFKHLAFSSHDTPENMIKLLDTGEFVGITLQYNLLDRTNEKVMEYADKKGYGVVVMGPVGGGRLTLPAGKLQRLVRGGVRSTPEIAMRFVLANPHVTTALSGITARQEILENVRVANLRTPLSPAGKHKARQALAQIRKLSNLYCTGCGYCMPCPHGVNIPKNFELMNLCRVWGLKEAAVQGYAELIDSERTGLQAQYCQECGACLPKCPQKINIIKQLKETHETLHT